jgi:hypothetical protein
VDQSKSTINGKANLIASGKFDEEMKKCIGMKI